MSSKPHAEMHEGRDAFERFRKAIKTIVSVPKSAATVDRKKPRPNKKRAAKT